MAKVNPYLELLKEEVVVCCSKTEPSINMLTELKMQDFRMMSKIIQSGLDELLSKMGKTTTGVFISVSTLRRMFKYGYSPDIKDARVTASLNKLAIFSGYPNWQTFIAKKQVQFNITEVSLETLLVEVVRKADDAEIQAYRHLPDIYTEELERCMILSGTAYMRIFNLLVEHSKKGWTISNPNNPSGYTRQKLWIERVTNMEVTIKTQEYWYLRWFELPTGRYRHIYNEENVQTWTLIFINGEWKVESTFYPPPKNSVHITHVVIATITGVLKAINKLKKLKSSN